MNGGKTNLRNNIGDALKLDPNDWDAPPKICNGETEYETKENVVRKRYTYEETIKILEEKIQTLLKQDEFSTSEAHDDLKFIQRQTRYSSDVVLNRRIVDHIVRSGIAHVYLRAWRSFAAVEYLLPENCRSFQDLQVVLSIVWNCTDKSAQLCESLVRGSVVHSMLGELADAKLVDADLAVADDARVYLVKAYLGVLHNVVRLCSDSRKIFRSAGAVDVLRRYLDRPQGLVRTKAYLVLSYVVTENESDVINATDENVAYMIGILRDALDGENHFSKMYAFGAAEIACGINHLAVNDSNKSRLGRLGVLPLYVVLLRSSNVDEQSLAAAGLWILSFRDENKLLMKREPGCVEALQFATSNSNHENICRAARGALWVIQSAPNHRTPDVLSTQDANVPHVMISYHWACQRTMNIVKERLKSEGYKVWMDIDNMSGSTLEAMALAVERAAVVLVCLSQGYKDSPSCRTEAEYMYRLRKDIVPLVLQPGYVPDGWLGILVGTKLYFDLSKMEGFDREVDRIVSEVGNRGRLVIAQESEVVVAVKSSLLSATPVEADSNRPSVLSLMSTSSMHSYSAKTNNSAAAWSSTDVKNWLSSIQVSILFDRFHDVDGSLLLQYKKMMETAPQFFYHTLEDTLHLDLVEILRFSKALEEIQ